MGKIIEMNLFLSIFLESKRVRPLQPGQGGESAGADKTLRQQIRHQRQQ
jgi:hypothetical protein